MNDTARIEAAIVKLEGLKAQSTRGPWKHEDEYGLAGGKSVGIPLYEYVTARAYTGSEANADLIVTLHRTIDAQLEILRNGVTWPSAHVTPRGKSLYLALADAILDGDS